MCSARPLARFAFSATLFLGVALGVGCVGLDLLNPYERGRLDAQQRNVILLPGIMGPDGNTFAVEDALAQSGICTLLWNWPQHSSMRGRGLWDALDRHEIEPCAIDLRERISGLMESDNRPRLSLIAASGGCRVVLRACEQLPEKTLDSIILVSAWFHSREDLTPALRAARSGVYLYVSEEDPVLRPYSAGRAGTTTRGVEQLRWGSLDPADRLDNGGGHIMAFQSRFFRRYVLPILTGTWEEGARSAWQRVK